MAQPYIVTVPESECLADSDIVIGLCLHFLDAETVSKMTSKCRFRITKNDVLRGFAFWFDAEFSGPQRNLMMSTAPGQPDTHWKQTVCCSFIVSTFAEDVTLPLWRA